MVEVETQTAKKKKITIKNSQEKTTAVEIHNYNNSKQNSSNDNNQPQITTGCTSGTNILIKTLQQRIAKNKVIVIFAIKS